MPRLESEEKWPLYHQASKRICTSTRWVSVIGLAWSCCMCL